MGRCLKTGLSSPHILAAREFYRNGECCPDLICQHPVKRMIESRRGLFGQFCAIRQDEREGKILTVLNHSSTCPTPHGGNVREPGMHFADLLEITERNPRISPMIDAKGRFGNRSKQRLVEGHLHRPIICFFGQQEVQTRYHSPIMNVPGLMPPHVFLPDSRRTDLRCPYGVVRFRKHPQGITR